MDFTNDDTFYNYVALWRSIVYKEAQRDALRMCGIKAQHEKVRTFKTPLAKRKLKRTNLKTGEITVFNNVYEAAEIVGVSVASIKTYVTMIIRDSKWEYVEDEQ